MDNNVEVAETFSNWETGAGFKGVGDKEVESHFTFVESEGYHVSTYVNLGFSEGKLKADEIDLGSY